MLENNSLVELLNQYASVYPRSPTGARGWVRDRREIPKTDPEVYIEWDRAHWRYHGEKDGWTFEHHFRPVNDRIPQPDNSEILMDDSDSLGPDDQAQQFIDTLLASQEAAVDSDAYFIVTLTPRQEDGLVIYEPEIFAEFLTPIAKKMVEAQIIQVASQFFQEGALDHLNQIQNNLGAGEHDWSDPEEE